MSRSTANLALIGTIVDAADLHAMPSRLDHRPNGCLGLFGECSQAIDQLFTPDVVGKHHQLPMLRSEAAIGTI
jgi:hypothetical protein